MVAPVGTQLGQTLAASGGDPAVLAAGLGSGAALAAVVQTPGLSHVFGCRPLGPIGWATGLGAATVATGVSIALPKVVSGARQRLHALRGAATLEDAPDVAPFVLVSDA
jgi:hypothetical protein